MKQTNDCMTERLWNAEYIKVMTTNFLLYFAFYLLTPLLPLYLSEQFSTTKDTIGIVLSGYTVAALVVRPFCGYVVDSFSRKRVLMCCLTAFLNMFVAVARHDQRGTANSSILTGWDLGFGIGCLLGGVVAEHWGYGAAFWMVALENACGVLLFFLAGCQFFLARKRVDE